MFGADRPVGSNLHLKEDLWLQHEEQTGRAGMGMDTPGGTYSNPMGRGGGHGGGQRDTGEEMEMERGERSGEILKKENR